MEIYLDANATTPVLPQAQAAALFAMASAFGNPSSTHGAGLKARALIEAVRSTARRLLGVSDGRVVFTSGATEGIHSAVLSVLHEVRVRRDAGEPIPHTVLYGATEHKAVPEALRHWNLLFGLGLRLLPIPVGRNGKHDLGWLADHVSEAALVCTMAANNETGVVSDLDGIAKVLGRSGARWLVDGVQALGKIELQLSERRIDYMPFSGHKLYGPKGVGMLYVSEGAPFTPLLTGGGQEEAQRGGTENVPGIAALGVVLDALESGDVFMSRSILHQHRERLIGALRGAFPGIVFNAPFDGCLPTTLNFSMPGATSNELINLFDAVGIRVSSGSACSAALAEPSHVLRAMALPTWQAESAVRLSFGLADSTVMIEEACKRLDACGRALKAMKGVGTARVTNQLSAPETEQSLEMSSYAVRDALHRKPPPLVVDVREDAERKQQSVAELDAETVPLWALPQALSRWCTLPAETTVIFVCQTGRRSALAAQALRRQGHANAWSLAGGLTGWS